MSLESLTKKISQFGLDEDEAKYYLFISIMGPIPIRNLVRRFDTNRVGIYRALERLVDQGFIEKIVGRPVRYVAKPIDEKTEEVINSLKKRIMALEEVRTDILSRWDKIAQGVETESEEPRFRFIQGRQQIYDQLLSLCENAQNDILFITTERDLHRLALFGFDDFLKPLIKSGVNLQLLTQVESLDFDEVYDYYKFTRIRHVPLPSPVRLIILDDSEALVTVAMDDSMSMSTQNDTGLWTNAESFITILRVFYNALWKLASDAPTVLNALKSGEQVQEIVTIGTKEQFIDRFKQMIQGCKKVDLCIRNLNNIPFEEVNKKLQNIEDVRLITEINLENLNQFTDISQKHTVKHQKSDNIMDILIVNEKEVLLHIPSWGQKEQSIWSNMTSYVQTIQYTFDDYWGRGEKINEVITRLSIENKGLELLQKTRKELEINNWIVLSPGSLVGDSGKKHTFSLTASNNGSRVGVDIIDEENLSGQVLKMGAKKVDLPQTEVFLICEKKPEGETENLAKIYRIKLVQESEIGDFIKKLD